MTAPIWMAAPPEVHSTLLSSGPGPGPLLASAQAWNSLSQSYTETADELTAALEAVQAGTWDGPSSQAYVAAHVPYLAWLTQASADSAATAAQQEVAATAYTAALAAMPTLGELAANHVTHGALLATNFLGINTIPIAVNEADYARMWVQAATVMGTYQTVAGAAVAASPQITPAPQVVKANSAASTAGSNTPTLPPDTEQQWLDWLQKIGYTDFYNNVLQPLINNLENNPFLVALFTQIDPYLPLLGNPLSFLNPLNIAFALGYPMDIGSYVAYLSETFSFIGLDIAAAFATGNPYAIGLTLVFGTVEAIGTIITDTIALLKTLLESVVILIPTVLPLLTVPLIPLAAAPLAGFAGLAGLAGLAAIPPIPIPPLPPAFALAVPPSPLPVPTPVAAPAPVPAHVVNSVPAHPPPPPPTPAGPPLATMQGYLYMIGVLSATARRAADQAAKAKEAQPAQGTEDPIPAAAPKKTPGGRRRRQTVELLGRGYEYMDLEPAVSPSTHGAGPLGFSGTATKVSAGAATGLTTLAEDDFGSAPRMPMMPSTWGNDSSEGTDDD